MISLLLCSSLCLIPTQEPKESPGALHLPKEGAELPLLDFGGRPMVEIWIDEEPLRVLLDTGSTLGLALSKKACERLGLEAIGETDLGPDGKARRFLLPELRMGDAAFEDVPTTELAFLGGMGGVDGVLGFPCFERCLVTFDFVHETVRLASGRLEPGSDTVPFHADEQMGFGMVLDLQVGGLPIPMHLDTGSPGTVLFSGLLREELPLDGEPRMAGRVNTPMGGADIFEAKLEGALRLGPIVVESPAVRFADLPQIAGRRLGNIGCDFFRKARITIDQKASLMRIEGGSPEAWATQSIEANNKSTDARKIGVQLASRGGGQFQVQRVMPGSAGEAAGLLTGDVLVDVDGQAFSQEVLLAALRGTAPVALTIERGGERQTVTLFAR